jgi:hypothetical protein
MESHQDSARTTLCDEEKFKDFSDIDSEDTPSLIQNSTRSRFFRPAIILLSVIAVLIPIIYFSISYKKGPKYDQCGTNADEARARGCVFETTGFTWVTKECHDQKTEDEFLKYIVKNELNLYRDTNYTDIVSIDEVREGNGPGCKHSQLLIVNLCLC